MANPLQDRFAEVLLEKIRGDNYPSVTQMDMFESVASPRLRAEFALHLMERIDEDMWPSVPMMQRVQRLIGEFGT